MVINIRKRDERYKKEKLCYQIQSVEMKENLEIHLCKIFFTMRLSFSPNYLGGFWAVKPKLRNLLPQRLVQRNIFISILGILKLLSKFHVL